VSAPQEWAALVPELVVSDFEVSLDFYVRGAGFTLEYQREGFAYLSLGKAQLMLSRDLGWQTGALEYPFGRGINFQIEVDDAEALQHRLADYGRKAFVPLEENWYRQDEVLHGDLEFLVMDPDGYLLRFSQPLGPRLAEQ
jgi:catechol 2,3-dioxygenase-like lactoylglutathione lyase family enzyme